MEEIKRNEPGIKKTLEEVKSLDLTNYADLASLAAKVDAAALEKAAEDPSERVLGQIISRQISLMKLQLKALEGSRGAKKTSSIRPPQSPSHPSVQTHKNLPEAERKLTPPKKAEATKKGSKASPEALDLTRKIWETSMGFEGIPGDANFFSIGGQSIIAVDICSRVKRETGIALSLKDLVQNPTINSFAELIPETPKSKGGGTKGLAYGQTSGPLTMTQFQVWYQEQVRTGTSMHNLPSALRLEGDIDVEKLKQAHQDVIKAHPALRTKIEAGPEMVVLSPEDAFLNVEFVDFSGKNDSELSTELARLAIEPFDLSQAPLVKAKIFKMGHGDHVLFHCFHHIIFDGWSFDLFFESLTKAYCGEDLPQEEASFLDFSKWEQIYLSGQDCEKELAFWVDKLSGPLPVLELPTDFPRPAQASQKAGCFFFDFPDETVLKIRAFCADKGISPFNLYLSCFGKALMDYSRSEDVMVAVASRGRNNVDQLKTIGFFVNTLILKASNRSNVKSMLEATAESVMEALDHQSVPFEKVRAALKIKRDPSRAPLAQSFFSYQDIGERKPALGARSAKELKVPKSDNHTDIDFFIKAFGKRVEGYFEYRMDLFEEVTIERFSRYFIDLIEFVVSGESEDWADFESKSVADQVAKLNETFSQREEKRLIPDFLDAIAQKTPEKTAVVAGDKEMSYGELSLLSSKMAGYLKSQGVRRGDMVGISLDRDERLLVTVLGVMKAGAGYVPLDPYFPPERLDYMIEQSGIKNLVTHEHYTHLFSRHEINLSKIEEIDLDSCPKAREELDPEQSAYIIYTSGSTGKPKGVDVSFSTAMNFLHSVMERPGFGPENKILAVTTFCFDISVLELFLPIVAGGTVYVATKQETIDGEALRRTIESKGIDVLQATPPTWRILLAAGWKGGEHFKVLCGGEAFPRDLAETLIPLCGEVWNMYGPTEATVWATCKKLESHKGTILIGRPLENYTVYTLDDNLKQVPFGAVGELYIGGDGLAKGYFNREDLTQERFLPDTVRGSGKMYKTGDLGRFHANGELECLGRNDDQVKVRGYRIELGEVEAALSECSEVGQAVAMAREDRPGDVRLVAYLILKQGELDQFGLREKLARKLPPYMIPANFIVLDSFPLTLTGKVDRKKLPAIDFEKVSEELEAGRRSGDSGEEVPEEEKKLAGIWMSVIGVDNYDLDDNFFDVGGNSLLSVELFSCISKEFGVDLPLSALIADSTFSALLKAVTEKKAANMADKPRAGKPATDKVRASEPTMSLEIPSICTSLVEIKKGGEKEPVFCFHSVGGNVLNYMNIASSFDGHPVFGVQAQGVQGDSSPLKSVKEMAKKYAREIRLVDPRGPYLLAGGSMGGLLALETASELQRAGGVVKSVIMFDSFGPGLCFKGYLGERNWLEEHLFSFKWNVKKHWVRVQSFLFEAMGLKVPHRLRHFNVEVCNYQALWSHEYSEYDVRVDLIRAPIQEASWYKDPYMGWRNVVKGPIQTHFANGDHNNFVESPEVAERLKSVLETC